MRSRHRCHLFYHFVDSHDAACYNFRPCCGALFRVLCTSLAATQPECNLKMGHQVFLGLGTNLGERQHNLEQAVAGLQEVMQITAVSPLYETAPWGLVDQPDFYNACLSGITTYSPQALLAFTKQLEQEIGRTPTVRWGPRLIDIDILLIDDLVLQEGGLTIPHPSIPERAFVLIPLADIAPHFVHPLLGQTIGELATAVDPTGVHRLPETWAVNTAVIA